MKVSLSWMQSLAQSTLPINEPDLIQKVGLQLGAIETVSDLAAIYQAALLVRVVSVKPLEGSDHLKVCLIDDNHQNSQVDRDSNGLVEVVCGANNVITDIIVVWLPPGTIVPATITKEPLTLTARKIMGVVSNGMLASAKELVIGDDHLGIVVLDPTSQPGQTLIDHLNLDDKIIDIENKMFTHRPDLFGQLGVARELCGIYGLPFKSPDWYLTPAALEGSSQVKLSVTNQLINGACPRFMALAIGNIKLGPSPIWLQSYLSRTGIRPINNIVDATNYAMMVTGQPLHAYDLAKITDTDEAEIIIRRPNAEEQLVLLDDSRITLVEDDIVVANKRGAIGLGGVMGGRESEVDNNTASIVLECATFDMYSIRRSSMAHGVFSEAVTRFTKGQSPWQCPAVLAYTVALIKQLCPEAQIISELVDSQSDQLAPIKEVKVELSLIAIYLGLEIDSSSLINILTNVELEARIEDSLLIVKPPFWRMDIVAAEDIIEEIARLYGFSNLPLALPKRSLLSPEKPALFQLRSAIRNSLTAAGANELLTYTFVDEKLMQDANQSLDLAFKLSNALSPDLKYYRTSLSPSLLKKVHPNHKTGFDRFCLFEMGKAHQTNLYDNDGLPIENERLALVFSAAPKAVKSHYQGSAYYQARHYLDYLLKQLRIDINRLSFELLNHQLEDSQWQPMVDLFYDGRSAVIKYQGTTIGLIGEYHQTLAKALKLPEFCAGFELDLRPLVGLMLKTDYHVLSKYPKVIQDITIKSSQQVLYQQVRSDLIAQLADLDSKDIFYELYLIDSYQSATDNQHTNWTFRIEINSFDRTLTDQEIANMLSKVKADN